MTKLGVLELGVEAEDELEDIDICDPPPDEGVIEMFDGIFGGRVDDVTEEVAGMTGAPSWSIFMTSGVVFLGIVILNELSICWG